MRYKLDKQERNWWCFPACLQSVLRRYQIFLSQGKIAGEIFLDESGAELKNVANFLSSLNFAFSFYSYNKTPFNEPDFLLEEGVQKGDALISIKNSSGRHVVLVEEFTYPFIIIADPKDAERYFVKLPELMRKMHHDSDGGFGLVERLSQ